MIARQHIGIVAIGAIILGSAPVSAEVSVPNEFQSGKTARAGEVNANFEALQTALNQALDRIDQLEQETDNLRAMNEHVSVVADAADPNEQRIVIEGVNLQLLNGAGKSAQESGQTNGLGNLIVGYGGARQYQSAIIDRVCSDGQYSDKTACEGAGEIWAADHRSGSHNVVVGYDNAYSANGGLIVGRKNANTAQHAVTFGVINTASGENAVVAGGRQSIASGRDAHIAGGRYSEATADGSVVVGGFFNEASALRSIVVGGESNEAGGKESVVLGGKNNNATTEEETIPAIP